MVLVSSSKISRKIHGLLALVHGLCGTRMSLTKGKGKIWVKHWLNWPKSCDTVYRLEGRDGERQSPCDAVKGQQGGNCHVALCSGSRTLVHLSATRPNIQICAESVAEWRWEQSCPQAHQPTKLKWKTDHLLVQKGKTPRKETEFWARNRQF